MGAFHLDLGAVLNSRYRIECLLSSTGRGRSFLATHLQRGGYVKIVEVPTSMTPALGRALLVSHRCLATLLEVVVSTGERSLAVVEHVPGKSLQAELEQRGALDPKQALECALALADALVELHQRRALHGLLSPASVLLEIEGRSASVLSYAPPTPEPDPYRCPEHTGDTRLPTDDVWSVAAVLHQALLGYPPPSFGYGSVVELLDAGVREPRVAELLSGCLACQPTHRISMIQPVRDWLAACSSAPPSAPEPPVSMPAERPEAPAPTSSAHPSRVASVRRWGVFSAVGLVAGALLGVAVWRLAPQRAARPRPAVGTAGASAQSVAVQHPRPELAPPLDFGHLGLAGAARFDLEALPSGDQVASCLMRQFPPDTFGSAPKADWLCSTRDPRKGVERVRTALVLGAGPNRLTDAMNVWSRLRWYGMATFRVIQQTCCHSATEATEQLDLPTLPLCPVAAPAVRELARAVASGKPYDDALTQYRRTMECHSFRGRATTFGVTGALGGGQEEAFLAWLTGRQATRFGGRNRGSDG